MAFRFSFIGLQILALFVLTTSFAQNSDEINKINSYFSGTWVSNQDAKYSMKVLEGKLLEQYEGEQTDTMNFQFSFTPCDSGYYSGKDTLLYFRKFTASDSYCFEVTNMDENHLALMWTENGKISSFHRKQINQALADTISYWKVSLHDKVILNGNPFQLDTITLTKGKINTSAILEVQYFDDTPCSDCEAVITVSDTKGNNLQQIELNESGIFPIKTTELQVLCANAKSNYLHIRHREAESSKEVPLFVFRLR